MNRLSNQFVVMTGQYTAPLNLAPIKHGLGSAITMQQATTMQIGKGRRIS